jgi:transglutaminase-like putative cysteine protease
MRLRIAHSTVYRYNPPANGAIQLLRLTPRNHDSQYVMHWRIYVSPDSRLATGEDAFGNITHVFSAAGPFGEMRVEVDGEIETQNTNGIVRGTVERFPPNLFLRATELTQTDAAIRNLAEDVGTAGGGATLDVLHVLMRRLHDAMAYDTTLTDTPMSAVEAFARKRGVCRDFTHIFIAAARCLAIPARYVAGYLQLADSSAAGQEAGHAWAEAFLPELGWVGFDPANALCPSDAYVRVAVGLDSLGAAPVRGARYGIGAERLEVAIQVDQ